MGTLDPRFADEIVRVFKDSQHDDPRVRRYLARAMEMVDDPKIVTALVGALDDPDEETRLFAIHSLGSLGAEAAVEDLLKFAKSEDAGFRIRRSNIPTPVPGSPGFSARVASRIQFG